MKKKNDSSRNPGVPPAPPADDDLMMKVSRTVGK